MSGPPAIAASGPIKDDGVGRGCLGRASPFDARVTIQGNDRVEPLVRPSGASVILGLLRYDPQAEPNDLSPTSNIVVAEKAPLLCSS